MAWRPASSVRHRLDAPELSLALAADGELTGQHGSVWLSGSDRDAVRLLLERHPDGVSVHALERALWPATTPSFYARRTRLMRVRRQLGAVGVALRCRPQVGYTVEVTPTR